MGKQIIAVTLVWLTTILGNLGKIGSNKFFSIGKLLISERVIGFGMIIITSAGLTWNLWDFRRENQKVTRLNEVIADAQASVFNEASGGIAIGDVAYIVDDEKPRVFKLHLNDSGKYEYRGEDITLNDGAGIVARSNVKAKDNKTGNSKSKNGKAKVDEGTDAETKDDGLKIDDLEAIAAKPNGSDALYLITSHSNSKGGVAKPERQELVEISLQPGKEGTVTKFQRNLRDAIAETFKNFHNDDLAARALQLKDDKLVRGNDKDKDKGIIQIEGLAIDGEDYAYLGFRSPVVERGRDKYALVLRAKLLDLFSDTVKFETILLDLGKDKSYGISSLDYDARTNSILIIGNDSEQIVNEPILFQWRFVPSALIQPTTILGPIGNGTPGRPELLLLPPGSDRIYTFLDNDGKGKGGQFSFQRSNLGLTVK